MRTGSFVARALAALLLAAPSLAPAQGTAAEKAPAPPALSQRVEQRIKSLHDQLKITAAEEPQWAAVADAMRDDAEKVGALIDQRRANASKMTAVEDLRSYQAIADAHAAGVAKLVPAFTALYDVMTPEQQKNADAVFAEAMHRRAERKTTK